MIASRLMHRYVGYVDTADYSRLAGWAVDHERPQESLSVEVLVDGACVGEAAAGLYRRDLEEAGIGDGRHAFEYDMAPHRGLAESPVSVRIAGTDVLLPYRRQEAFRIAPPPLISYVAADIVNNCNLRCPFCLVDYSGVTHTETMTEDTFRRLLGLIGAVPEEGLWLSCLHEPTLHPRLDDFIEMIPPEHRRKAWFTTNLARPLPDETFLRWARSGIHHVNVSLDTLDEKLYSVLRRFGRYRIFRGNLDRMAAIFAGEPRAPRLRFITVVFRSNLDEIERIVEHSATQWRSSENEIRYTINVSHIDDAFRREHHLRREDWPVLTERVSRIPHPLKIVYPPDDEYADRVELAANYFELRPQGGVQQLVRLERPLALRARPNGTLVLVGREGQFTVNIRDLENPLAFFEEVTAPR
jgi:hypothetical protein